MSDTNDEAQQADQPPATQPRRTAMQVAEAAMSVAEGARTEADNAIGLFEGLFEKFTELDQRTRGDVAQSDGISWGDEIAQVRRELTDRETAHAELRDETMRELSLLRDGVDNRIHEALQPFREEMGGYQGAVNRRLDEHRMRITDLEKLAKGDVNMLKSLVDGDPASETMAEDAQHDLVADMVKGQLSQLMARLEAAEQKAAKAEAALAQGMKLANPVAGVDPQYVADLGNRVTTLETHKENETSFTAQLQERVEELEGVWERASLPGVRASVDTLTTEGTGAQRKVLALMRAVDVIGKDRQVNAPGQKYAYRGVDDAMDAVGRAMRDIGLIYSPEVLDKQVSHDEAENSSGRRLLWTSVYLTVRYTFTDPEDGSTHDFTMAGEGRASDDKATSKAHAMALKYGLLHALMVPVSDIPDADAEQPQVSRAAQQQPDRRPAQAPAQQEQQAPRKPLVERARDAVTALQNLHRHPAERRSDVLANIVAQASHEGLLDIPVDTGDGPAPVKAYARGAQATLQAAGPSF